MKRKLQVFISSTFTDLIEERQAAVSAVLKSGHIPAGMELFTAGDRSQMDTITGWIDESDVYMLILGGRYGSVESSTNLSYTELEFDYAASQNKPMFSVVINEQALEQKVQGKGTSVLEKENPKELKLFRNKVLSKVSSFFDDVKDIKLCVHESLSELAAKRELTGWVSASAIVDTKPLFDEIKKLSDENWTLRESVQRLELRAATAPKATKDDTAHFVELKEVLSDISIKVPGKLGKREEDFEMNLLEIFFENREAIVPGVTNAIDNGGDFIDFLYFNVFPKLQVHGLADNEKISGVKYRRCYLTQLGIQLLAYLEKEDIKHRKELAALKAKKKKK